MRSSAANDGFHEAIDDTIAREALTGSKQMDAIAVLDYLAALSKRLDEQLAGKQVGWGS